MRSPENQRLTDAINQTLREDQEAREHAIGTWIIAVAIALACGLGALVWACYR